MRSPIAITLYLIFNASFLNQSIANQVNPEDEDILDEPLPTAPAKPAPTQSAPTQPVQPAPAQPAPTQPAPPTPPVETPIQAVPSAPTPNTADTVTIPRAVWEQLLRDVEELKRSRATGVAPTTPAPSTPPATTPGATGNEEDPPPLEAPGTTPNTTSTDTGTGNRNYLKLPDISFIGQIKGKVGSDRRDTDRNTLRFTEGELAIQSYVYPNVRADAFIVGAPAEGEPLGIEEAYLSFLGLRKNVNVIVGRKFAPFGRTGEQHPHSWPYARQLLPRRNLVAEEALTGDGVLLRYLIPTGKRLFANLDLGVWTGEGTEATLSSDPADPFAGEIAGGTGTGFSDRFYTGRLWLGAPLGRDGELELGTSYATGRSVLNDDADPANAFAGKVKLSGADISYRKFFGGNRRLLLRSEYFGYRPRGGLSAAGGTRGANGYYGLANYKFSKYGDVGLLFERSGFPQAPGARERALSLIFTKQFTEQFYIRLHGTRGSRPGQGNYSEVLLQFVFGLGPHSHNLE